MLGLELNLGKNMRYISGVSYKNNGKKNIRFSLCGIQLVGNTFREEKKCHLDEQWI